MQTAEFNQCVDHHSDGLYRFILKSTRDSELAKDVVQESFARLWENRNNVSDGKAKSYLFSTGYHYMIDLLRKEKRNGDMEQLEVEPYQNDRPGFELNEILHEALEKLPQIQKSVIMLRDYEGYSYEEIGEICKLNESQVKVYIFRARKALKDYIVKMELVV